MTRTISLNTDIGEGFGAWRIADDDALLALVTDANVACGFHAGDPDVLRRTCEIAASRGITVGAQVGYDDLRGFGRRFIEVEPASLTNDVLYQLGALSAFTTAVGSTIGYVKIHGALYHAAIARPAYAEAILDAVRLFDPALAFLCQPGTSLASAVEAAGLPVIGEGYVDRAYTREGLLVPRERPGAVLTDPEACARRAVRMAVDGEVECEDGTVIAMPVDSLCIHSDSPGAVGLATAVRTALAAAGVGLVSVGA